MPLTGLEALPPIVIALIALASGLLWQTAGALTLFRLTPRSLSVTTRLLIAWFLWLPVSGAAVLALVLMGVASRSVLLAGTALVAVAALFSLAPLRAALAKGRTTWARWKVESSPLQRGLFRGGVVLQIIGWLFAGHPQRQIDQFNYHLVVGHLVVRDGQPFTGALDPHVSFAGVVEYGLAWYQAWTHSTLLFIGMSQVAVMLAIVPVVIACGLRLGGGSLGLFGVLLIAIPALIPEGNMVHIAKPDGVVLAGVMLLLTLLAERTAGWFLLAIGIGALCAAAKVTTVHVVPALLATALILRPPRGKPAEFAPLIFLGIAALALQWGKNTLRFGDPVYPAGAAFFHSPLWDADAAGYWTRIAFEGRPRWRGFLGLFTLAARSLSLTVCLIVAGVLVFRSWRIRRPEAKSDPLLKALFVFLLVCSAMWPLFYSDVIYPRFVSGVSAGLLVLWLALYARVDTAARPKLWVVSAIAALLSSQLDGSLPRLWRWSHLSAFEAMAEQQYSRLRTIAALQPELTSTDAVLADRPEKIFFEPVVVYPAEASPRERAVIKELGDHPREAALRLHLKAIIVNRDTPPSSAIAAAWAALESHGTVREIGPDRVLWSANWFQSAP